MVDDESGKLRIRGLEDDTNYTEALAEFLDAQEKDQELFITYALDPSFICTELAEDCASKSMDEFFGSYQVPDAIYK
jgi:hypothetical protein